MPYWLPVLACWGLRIAHRSRTSKHAEASRRYSADMPAIDAHAATIGDTYISTLASTVCYIPDYDMKVAKFQQAKN